MMDRKRFQRYYFYALAAAVVVAAVVNLYEVRSMQRVKLFFIHRGSGRLAVQQAYIPRTRSSNERVRWILRELIAGPADSRYERTLDPDVTIREVIVQSGTAYVSLDWGIVDSLSRDPTLVVQSIVRSILRNARELDDVRILIEGTEPVSSLFGASIGMAKKY